MELIVYDKTFTPLALLDSYESLIWTERYYSCGDFEIELAPSEKSIELLQMGYYIWNTDDVDVVGSSDMRRRVMIIEKLEIQTDAEDGDHLIVTGRSLESILDRRIVWKMTDIADATNLQAAVRRLITENITSPSDANRVISNFIFEETTDPAITGLAVGETQILGDTLYDVISTICEDYRIGFKITLNDSNQFCFKLYSGIDRSYDQTDNVYVCFSQSYGNLINSNYYRDDTDFKNITLIGGEGEGNERKFTSFFNSVTEPTELERKEIFTDSSSTSSKAYDQYGSARQMTNAEYINVLKQTGADTLLEAKEKQEFEAEIDATEQYVLFRDFNIGDYVEIVNEYGVEKTAIITEIIRSQDPSGIKTYPAFEIVDTFSDLYTSIQYIGSTGTQYIDTGFVPDGSSGYKMTFSVVSDTYDDEWIPLGSSTTSSYQNGRNWTYDLYRSRGGTVVYGEGQSTFHTSKLLTANQKYVVDFNTKGDGKVLYDGTLFETLQTMIIGSLPSAFVFARNVENSPTHKAAAFNLYSLQLTNNSVVSRDFIPVIRKEDNQPGLYDKITRQFYKNKGTGTFVYA